jgi:hypothetical protein
MALSIGCLAMVPTFIILANLSVAIFGATGAGVALLVSWPVGGWVAYRVAVATGRYGKNPDGTNRG